MKFHVLLVFASYSLFVSAQQTEVSSRNSNPDPVYDQLVWSDDFEGSGAINTDKWFHQTRLPNGNSWYNGEIQHYTNRTENTSVSDGFLHLVAKKEMFLDQGVTKQYTSARLNSKFAFTYGKVEVRAKLPTGVGTWPAIWMLGKNITEPGGYWTSTYGTTGWPGCGEIDIMEHWGNNQNFVQSAMHTPSSYGGTVNHGGQNISTASTAFHVYTLEWYEDKMVFKVDGNEHYRYVPTVLNSSTWPFTADQYLLLNIAIQPSISSSFTQSEMTIDYVRVYQQATASLEEVEAMNSIKIFPNSIDDKVTIHIQPELIGVKGTLYSLLGQKMFSFVQDSSKKEYDFSALKTGVYIIKFSSNMNTSTYKVLKQ
jgi:beta-glucanase (GH16 family)